MECANLAAECNLPELLPSALLWLCGLDIKHIFSGCIGPNSAPIMLLPLNLQRCMVGLDALRAAQNRETFGYHESLPLEGCLSEEERRDFCNEQFREYVEPPASH
jgi:hypothetical protein